MGNSPGHCYHRRNRRRQIIIIGALQLLLGERRDKSFGPDWERNAHGRGNFSRQLISRNGMRISRIGNRTCDPFDSETQPFSFRNEPSVHHGSPTTRGISRSLVTIWVDLHGPHDHHHSFHRSGQLDLLDALLMRMNRGENSGKFPGNYARSKRNTQRLIRRRPHVTGARFVATSGQRDHLG